MKVDLRTHMYGAPATARDLVTQRFRDPELELAFQQEASRQFRGQATNTLLLGAATWAVTGTLLWLLFPVNPARIAASIGIVELLIFMVYGTLERARTWDQVQTASALANLIGGVAIIVIGGFEVDMPYLVAPALLVNLIFAFGISRFGPIGVVVTVPYGLLFAALVFSGTLPTLGAFEVFLVGVGFFVSALSGYLLEATTRGIFFQRRIIEAQAEALAAEKQRTERLLANMLPTGIATRLMDGRHVADSVPAASVLFADLAGFTALSSQMAPDAVVTLLDQLFGTFDELSDRHGLEKIKTIGDAYMAVSGAIEPVADHARRAVALGLDMLDAVAALAQRTGMDLRLRVGISSGPLVAGVIGRTRYSYDLWGDTVNVASRMESQGVAGQVQVSAGAAEELRAAASLGLADELGSAYDLVSVGPVEIKGKGLMQTFLVRPISGRARDDDRTDMAEVGRERSMTGGQPFHANGRRNERRPATTQPTPIPTA